VIAEAMETISYATQAKRPCAGELIPGRYECKTPFPGSYVGTALRI
jgi:hypothetical protein